MPLIGGAVVSGRATIGCHNIYNTSCYNGWGIIVLVHVRSLISLAQKQLYPLPNHYFPPLTQNGFGSPTGVTCIVDCFESICTAPRGFWACAHARTAFFGQLRDESETTWHAANSKLISEFCFIFTIIWFFIEILKIRKSLHYFIKINISLKMISFDIIIFNRNKNINRCTIHLARAHLDIG